MQRYPATQEPCRELVRMVSQQAIEHFESFQRLVGPFQEERVIDPKRNGGWVILECGSKRFRRGFGLVQHFLANRETMAWGRFPDLFVDRRERRTITFREAKLKLLGSL